MQSTGIFRRMAAILPALVMLASLGLSLYDPRGLATAVSDITFDIYQQVKPRPTEAQRAVYIDIGNESAARYGSWPWPRARLADLVETTRTAGAEAIVLDIALPNPDVTSPREALKLWSPLPAGADLAALAANLGALPDHDTQLADALREGPSVVTTRPGKGTATQTTVRTTIEASGGNPLRYAPAFDHWTETLGRVARNATTTGVGLPALLPGDTVRHLPLLTNLDGKLIPSSALEALRITAGGGDISVQVRVPESAFFLGENPGIDSISLADNTRALTGPDGALRLYYRSAVQHSTYEATDIFDQAETLDLSGKIAVIGFSVNGAEKTFSTVVGQLPSGAILAEAIDQIASGAYLVRPAWASTAEQGFILIGALLIILITLNMRTIWALVITAALIGGSAYGGWYAFDAEGWLIDTLFPALTLLLVFLTTAMMNRFRVEAETRFIENQMARRLSNRALGKVVRNPKLIPTKGEQREISSVVVGLRGFNIIADRYLEDPEAYGDILNRFFTPITKTVHDRGGMVDRYNGDTLHAVWNAPLDEPDHAMKACDAALRMREQLDALNEFLEEDARRHNLSHIPLSVSIGIESGSAITGNMGATQRFDYGVLGEPVNIAHYLRDHALDYGPAVIVGDGFKEKIGDRFALLEVDLVSTPRHPEGWRAYALLGDSIVRASPKFRALEEGHRQLFDAYRSQRWDAAREAIAHCRTLNGSISTLYDFYEGRIRHLEAEPPSANWNGSYFAGRF